MEATYVDGELRKQAQAVLEQMGLDVTTALNAFLKQIVTKKVATF